MDDAVDLCKSKGYIHIYYQRNASVIVALDEHDIDIIQAILDGSSDDEDDEMLFLDDHIAMPKPLK